MPTYPSQDTGPVDVSRLPPDVVDSVYVVADAAARLALTAYEGDECIQTDDGSQWLYDDGVGWIVRPSSVGGAPSGPASGDLGDFYPGPSVVGLQGDSLPVFSAGGTLSRNAADTAWVSSDEVESTVTALLGQVTFILPSTPLSASRVQMYVNGVEYEQGVGKDFTVSGTTVTWLNTPFSLDPDDKVTLRYMSE